MILEKRGIPTVFLCPESFRGIVESHAKLSGMPSYKAVTMPGRIVALSPEELTDKLDKAADRIVRGLALASAKG
jgi:hypothetical protein